MRRIEALIRRAAKTLDCSASWISYKRPFEDLLGKEVKKELNFMKTGVLSRAEVDYLSNKHRSALEAYDNLPSAWRHTTLVNVSGFQTEIIRVNKLLSIPCSMVDKVISIRMKLIYPSSKKEKKQAKKTPLQELISGMDPLVMLMAMDPGQLSGLREFKISEDLLEAGIDGLTREQILSLVHGYKRRIDAVRRTDSALATHMDQWFDTDIEPQIRASHGEDFFIGMRTASALESSVEAESGPEE